jgi:hypothetical protein
MRTLGGDKLFHEAGFIAPPNIISRSILCSLAHLLSCCPLALLISCDFDLVPTNVHAAPATRTLFAGI